MNEQNRILTAVLALQVVVLAIVFWPSQSVARGERLFSDVSLDQITKITITEKTGEHIVLQKGENGWVLPEGGDFPVEENKITTLLDSIIGLQTDRLVTRTADSHKRLGVADDDFERLIEFQLENGASHKLFLGTSPRYQVLHVRADGHDEVYLALGLTTADAGFRPADWINTSYFSVPSDQIESILLTNQNGRFEFTRSEGDTWVMVDLPAGTELRENNVSSLATRVSALNMVKPLGQDEQDRYGMDSPNAVVSIGTRDEDGTEKTFVIKVGALLEDEGGYVAKSATSPYYVLVAEYTVSDLVERTMDDFAGLPATPTPEPIEP
jgi:hypothetical protein